jgi:hypothetical protein
VPIHVTGNPRIDVLRREVRPYFSDEVHRLRERFGRFVLINSNFGHVNHFVTSLRMEEHGGQPLGVFEAALAAHRSAVYGHFRRMITEVADALPDHTVVVRPHPVEVHDPWRELARGHPNIVVDNAGNVIPWLMACSVVIQNGCQTAVEAALLGTPVLNFKPVASHLDVELIESLGHEVKSVDDLLVAVRRVLAGELGPRDDAEGRRQIARHIAALDGPLASERVVDLLVEAGYAAGPPPATALSRRLRGAARNRYRTLKKLNNMRKRGHRNDRRYHKHRYPELGVQDVRERIDRLGKQLGRFEDVQVERESRYIFRIAR